jgi:PHD/YefM family antitoxin component YafN of YafNO toxin-antitoxin module
MQISVIDDNQSLVSLARRAQLEPVTLREDDRDVAVVLSHADYRRLQSAELEDFAAFRRRMASYAESQGMTEGVLQELLADDAR